MIKNVFNVRWELVGIHLKNESNIDCALMWCILRANVVHITC